MALTDTKVKAVKPAEKDFKLYDEKGLFLLVKANGSKYWRAKYTLGGKEKLLALVCIQKLPSRMPAPCAIAHALNLPKA